MNNDFDDASARVLALAVSALPAGRHEWGLAMTAELAELEDRRDRWRFALGCAGTVARRPALGVVAFPAVGVVVLVMTIVLTARSGYPPLQVGFVLMAAALIALGFVGRSGGALGPPKAGWLGPSVRTVAAVLLAGLTLGLVAHDADPGGDLRSRATVGVPAFTVILALYMLGVLAVTSRRAGPTRGLAIGTVAGLVGAGTWCIHAVRTVPISLSAGWAFGLVVATMLAAAAVGAFSRAGLSAALTAGVVSTLLIFVTVDIALAYGPSRWVPADSAALTAAGRLEQSRAEASESYLGLLLVGALVALVAVVVAVRSTTVTSVRWSSSPGVSAQR